MKKKIFIFDLDGVLVNSKENMLYAWNYTKKKNNLNVQFSIYFKNIGMPFKNILKKIGIDKNHSLIEKYFQEESIKKINKIKIYPNVRKTLIKIKKNNKIGILTSKDKVRTIKILKKFKLNSLFDFIECPKKGLRGKPFPDQILKIIESRSISPSLVTYVGDMKSDYITAKRARVNFVFAKYGYGKVLKTKYINKFPDIINFL